MYILLQNRELLQIEKPTYENLLIILAIVITYFLATEAVKLLYYRKENKSTDY